MLAYRDQRTGEIVAGYGLTHQIIDRDVFSAAVGSSRRLDFADPGISVANADLTGPPPRPGSTST